MTTPTSDPQSTDPRKNFAEEPAVSAILNRFKHFPISTAADIVPVVATAEGGPRHGLDDQTRSLLRLMVRAELLLAVERVPVLAIPLDRGPVYRFRDEFVAEAREIRDARLYSSIDDEQLGSFSARLVGRFESRTKVRLATVFVSKDAPDVVPLLEAERETFDTRTCDGETIRRRVGESFALTRLHVARTISTPGKDWRDPQPPSYLWLLTLNVSDDPLAPHAFHPRLSGVPDVVDTWERLQSGMAVYFGGCRNKGELEELHNHFVENYLSDLCPGYALW